VRAKGLLAGLGLLLAGCGVKGPALAGYEGLQFKVRSYYAEHASEYNATCLRPEIEGITRTRVVEDSEERLVVDVRYRFKDEQYAIEGHPQITHGRNTCEGFANRTFTIDKTEDGLVVTAMSGERRTG